MSTTRRQSLFLASALAFALGATGCTNPTAGDGSSEPTDASKANPLLDVSCSQTEYDQCVIDRNSQCDICEANCASSGTCVDCADACADYTCGSALRSICVHKEFTFHLNDTPDPQVVASCRDFLRFEQLCGYTGDASPCDYFARVERPEMAPVYECFSHQACGADPSTCNAPPPTGLGDEVCQHLSDACGEPCSQDFLDFFHNSEGWLRPESADALRACFDQQSCGDLSDCVDAWISAVGWDSF